MLQEAIMMTGVSVVEIYMKNEVVFYKESFFGGHYSLQRGRGVRLVWTIILSSKRRDKNLLN